MWGNLSSVCWICVHDNYLIVLSPFHTFRQTSDTRFRFIRENEDENADKKYERPNYARGQTWDKQAVDVPEVRRFPVLWHILRLIYKWKWVFILLLVFRYLDIS